MNRTRVKNLALVPASLLPLRDRYQRIADELPRNSVLICLPKRYGPQRQALAIAGALLQARGHRVMTVAAERLA